MILNDSQINYLAMNEKMIEPFFSSNMKEVERKDNDLLPYREKSISYGTSSFGYDIRIDGYMKVFTDAFNGIIDPKNFDKGNTIELVAEPDKNYIILPPHSFALAESKEYIKMPQDVLAILFTKSTIARCGLICHTTVMEPGWEGTITLELSNTTPLPMKVYVDEGIAQLIFIQGERPITTYSDRAGKYQGQQGITMPKV